MALAWLSLLWLLVSFAAVILSFPGTLELLLVTAGNLLPEAGKPPRTGKLRVCCVIPAHNEAEGIADCVASLARSARERPVETVVIADNCTDATAARARSAGARVLERHDGEKRGKGYALDFAFRRLMAEGADAFVVVDADSRVSANFVKTMCLALESGAGAVQCRYLVANPEASRRTRLMNVALLAFNVVRPRGRARWGLSAGILGNGFGLTRETLERVPYTASSVVEDLEYHLALVRAGRAVQFVDGCAVYGEAPAGGQGVRTQRARWEGGRFRMIAAFAPELAAEVLRGKGKLAEPLLELLLLPLALHVTLLGAALLSPHPWARALGAAGLGAAALHIAAALSLGRATWRDIGALLTAPLYIAWKILMLPSIFRASRRGAHWVRTERNQERAARL